MNGGDPQDAITSDLAARCPTKRSLLRKPRAPGRRPTLERARFQSFCPRTALQPRTCSAANRVGEICSPSGLLARRHSLKPNSAKCTLGTYDEGHFVPYTDKISKHSPISVQEMPTTLATPCRYCIGKNKNHAELSTLYIGWRGICGNCCEDYRAGTATQPVAAQAPSTSHR